jgi:hypothetical protein
MRGGVGVCFSCDLFFLFIYIAQYPLHSASRILVGVSRSYDLFLVFVFKRKKPIVWLSFLSCETSLIQEKEKGLWEFIMFSLFTLLNFGIHSI